MMMMMILQQLIMMKRCDLSKQTQITTHTKSTRLQVRTPTNSPGSSSTNENEGQIEPESSPDMYMHNTIAYLKRVRFSRAMKSARKSAATCADNRRAASLQRQAAESARRAKNF